MNNEDNQIPDPSILFVTAEMREGNNVFNRLKSICCFGDYSELIQYKNIPSKWIEVLISYMVYKKMDIESWEVFDEGRFNDVEKCIQYLRNGCLRTYKDVLLYGAKYKFDLSQSQS
jgi:hypothetical protein